jgi:hypothetical protein
MKQARKAGDGASRRERAKRCGRNVRSKSGTSITQWTSPADVAKRKPNPQEGARVGSTGNRKISGVFETAGGRWSESSEEDDKARGSTNQPVKRLGTATGNASRKAGKPLISRGFGMTQKVPITGRRLPLRGAVEPHGRQDAAK